LYGAPVVTLVTVRLLLRLINCHFIIMCFYFAPVPLYWHGAGWPVGILIRIYKLLCKMHIYKLSEFR